MATKKKRCKKSLIPLPPTGFASLFCAKVRAVQTPALPRPAAGAGGVEAIARSARFCKKEQGCCTALRRVDELARGVKRPACRGYDLKNLLHRMFSFSELVVPAGDSTQPSPLEKRLKGPACLALRHSLVLHSVTKDLLATSANLHDVKNVEKGCRLGHFSNVGWEKGNFGKRDIEMGYSPCSSWSSAITSRGNFR